MELQKWVTKSSNVLNDIADEYDAEATGFGYNLKLEQYYATVFTSPITPETGWGNDMTEALANLDLLLDKKRNDKQTKIADLKQQLARLEA